MKKSSKQTNFSNLNKQINSHKQFHTYKTDLMKNKQHISSLSGESLEVIVIYVYFQSNYQRSTKTLFKPKALKKHKNKKTIDVNS